MNEKHRWRHLFSATKVRGKWRGSCVCGWQSPSAFDLSEVEAAYKAHTDLVEKERTPAGR